MVLQGEIEDIMLSIDNSNPVLITVYSQMEKAVSLLRSHPLVTRMSIDRNVISILFSGSREEEALLMREIVEAGVLVTSFTREHNSLESVFFNLVEPEKS